MVTVSVKLKDAVTVEVYQNESTTVKIRAQIVRIGIVVDDELSSESTNPVQNRVVAAELKRLEEEISIRGTADDVDWEDIKNRPFYDTRVRSYYSQVENPNPISFGNELMNMSFYKVSDLIPTRDEIFGSTRLFVNGNKYSFSESGIMLETEDFIYVWETEMYFAFCFVNKSGTVNFNYPVGGSVYPMSLEVPEVGIYYPRDLNAGVPAGRTIEFIVGDGELKQIDPKFIPEVDALPKVSSSDNGKILCVEDGMWTVKSMSEWSGGSY